MVWGQWWSCEGRVRRQEKRENGGGGEGGVYFSHRQEVFEHNPKRRAERDRNPMTGTLSCVSVVGALDSNRRKVHWSCDCALVSSWGCRSGAGAWQSPTKPQRRQFFHLSSDICALKPNTLQASGKSSPINAESCIIPLFLWYTFLLRTRHLSFRHSVAASRRKDSRLAEWHPRVHHNEIWLARLREASL